MNTLKKIIMLIALAILCTVVYIDNVQAAQIIQLTDITQGTASFPSVNANGKVVFSSNANLTGENPDGSDELFVINKNGMGLKQITNFEENDIVGFFRIAGRADVITFNSNANLSLGTNPDRNFEIFTIKIDGTELRQITITKEPVQNTFVSINPTGDVTAFQCTTQNPSNFGGEAEKICLANFNGSLTTRLSEPEVFQFASPTITSAPFIDITPFPGNHLVAFSTTKLDLVPIGEDEQQGSASFEIFTAEVDQNLQPIKFHQLTATPKGDLLNKFTPRISEDGSTVAFVNSTNRQNPDMTFTPVTRIDVVSTDGSNLTMLYQNFEECGDPTISGDGNKIIFNCKANFTGENSDGNNEIFSVNRDGSNIQQITNTTDGDNLFPYIDPTGKFIVWESTSNINGQNPNGKPQIYFHGDLETTERPEIIGGGPRIQVPSGFSFLDTKAGSAAQATFDIKNIGDEDLIVTNLKILMAMNSPFTIVGGANVPFTLAPDQSTTFTVNFNPTKRAAFESTVRVISNDPQRHIVTFKIFGRGIQPELTGAVIKAKEKKESDTKFIIDAKLGVKNVGDADSGAFSVGLFLSKDQFLDQNDILLKEIPAANQPPKTDSIKDEKLEHTESARGKFLIMFIDNLDQVVEKNEVNNKKVNRIR